MEQRDITFHSLDGTVLSGTRRLPADSTRSAVLVHGGGMTRDEGGFFVRLVDALDAARVASVRFDLRGHGSSGGRQQDLTLAAVANDIRAAAEDLRRITAHSGVALIATSFSGGVAAAVAAGRTTPVTSLTLLNPLLDYKQRFVDEKPYWRDDHLVPLSAAELELHGYVPHSPTFRLGRALLNEVFHFPVRDALPRIGVPTLIAHGTRDTFISIGSSRAAAQRLTGECALVEIEGAQHGFAVHDDPEYRNPQTREWQALVIRTIVDWVVTH